ncbi:hypothetical protein ACW5F0_04630 [Luteimonas sp. A534]
MRTLAWAAGALVAFAAVTYAVLLVVNWNDESASADAERLTAMMRDRLVLADTANGYIHALGLAAAQDTDPVALGSVRNAHIEAFTPSSFGAYFPELPGEDADYKAARSPEVAALATACSEAAACVEALHAHPEAVAQWLAGEQWLLDRYGRMLATDGWRDPIPADIGVPLAGYQHPMEIQKLHLVAVRQHAIARDAGAVRDLLEQDLVFWRQVLASSDLLVSKMIAAAGVRRNFAFGNLALAELPPDLAAAAVPPSWRQPMSVAERSLARALGGEWHATGGSLRMVMSPEAQTANSRSQVSERLLRPLFQPQATLNLFAARMVELGRLSELPYPEMGQALDGLAEPQNDASPGFRLYNPVGAILDSIAAPAYTNYIARLTDLEGQRRAALLAATLRAGGISREGAADAVRDAPLRRPHDGAPFEWDAASGSIVFHGLEQGERGRHVVLF